MQGTHDDFVTQRTMVHKMSDIKRLGSIFALSCLCLSSFMAGSAMAEWLGSSTMEEIATPALTNSQQHHLNRTADGRLILSWVEVAEGNSTARFAIRDGNHWTEPYTVVSVPGKLADPPVVLGLTDGTLAAAWMSYVPGSTNRYAAEIYLARSSDDGRSWSAPIKPYGAEARIYDAQMSLTALPESKLALVWTDMRYAKEKPVDSGHAGETHRYQVMATILGAGMNPGVEITLDADVCSCCHSDTAAQGDELLTVYRDHTAGEVRDNAVVRWNAAGDVRVVPFHAEGWVINGCPSNGSAVGWAGTTAAVAWFTAADGIGRVRLAFSNDNGVNFAQPIEVDADALGYPHVVILEDSSALVSWRGRNGPEEELRLARVMPTGEVGYRTTIYKGGFPKWPSKYPDLAMVGGKAYLAWTDPLQKRVRLVAVAMGD